MFPEPKALYEIKFDSWRPRSNTEKLGLKALFPSSTEEITIEGKSDLR